MFALFLLRFLVGMAESPSFPANTRIVAAWFPAAERGTASAIFNSGQYFATVLFAPIMGFSTVKAGWQWEFYFMGGIGIVVSLIWLKVIYSPKDHPRLSPDELNYIAGGGALVNMDQPKGAQTATCAPALPLWDCVKDLLQSRMMLGIYVAQACVNAITYFFITWFPVYLVQQRGMSILNAGIVASIPTICGFLGGILSGVFSDFLIRRGYSLTVARKTPIVAAMLASMSMILCNFVDAPWLTIFIMALSFFGKGLGALGWAVVSDTSPREIAEVSGGLFNTFSNASSITTPIVIGFIIQSTGSFDWALIFIGANALVTIVSYLLVVGEIKRLELRKPQTA
jgi:ACS family glucarate transporter-like MFS transporter